MNIQVESPPGLDIIALLQEHHANMLQHSPPDSVHALDLKGMQAENLCFWAVREEQLLVACGALKELNLTEGEVKSMKTAEGFQSRGFASALLTTIIAESRSRNYQRLYLETGTNAVFEPARRLYTQFGFVKCSPFSDYKTDAASVFMCKRL